MPTTNQKETGRKSLPVKWREHAWAARITIRPANRWLETRAACGAVLTGLPPRAVRKIQAPGWGRAVRSPLSFSRKAALSLSTQCALSSSRPQNLL